MNRSLLLRSALALLARRASFSPRAPLLLAALIALAVLVTGLSGCAGTPGAKPAAASAASASSKILGRVEAEMDKHSVSRDASLRLLRGLPIQRLPDLSLDAARSEAAFGKQVLAELATVREEELSSYDIDSLGILRYHAEQLTGGERFYWLDVLITPYRSPVRTVNQVFALHAFDHPGDAENYLALLDSYATWITGIEALLREQARRGRVLPAPEIPLTLPQFQALLKDDSSFFQVAPERLKALPKELRDRFPGTISAKVRERLAPTVRHLIAYLEGDYARAAPPGVGLSQYAGGEEFYRWLVRQNTTLDLEPEEIHRIGLAEMARIQGEMENVRVEVGFQGTFAEFLTWARTAPRFFVKTPEEVGAKLMAAQERFTPQLLAKFFGRFPKAPYGVARLDPALEGAMTFGFYDAPNRDRDRGLYYFNGSQLERRSTLSSAALIYHELAPGHHFQIALQRESDRLLPFRRENFTTAYTEGWGEYASALAGEAGLYADPYDRLGRLMMEAFITTRLVVDTGMNLLGWSREKAMDYMATNTLQSPEEIASESLRYSCDIPAQALAYKLGAWKIRQLRDRAEQELGASFDIRGFHDELLADGTMPLTVLEKRMERYVAARQEQAHR